MSLLEIKLNHYIFLKDYNFQDEANNIEFLNKKAKESTNINLQLDLLNRATSKIEKFHSFFHFEQSYFHLQFAIELISKKRINDTKNQLEAAIFQDHNNQQAIYLLEEVNSSDLTSRVTSKSLNYDSSTVYKRRFDNYYQYLAFASEEDHIQNHPSNFWKNFFSREAEKIITDLKFFHLNYHQESAKLYLNRAIIFKKLGLIELANNDLRKANNLDRELLSRDYFNKIITELGSKVILGLGSNLGKREFFLQESVKRLNQEKILYEIKSSEIEETEALLKPGSPSEWNINYLNQVIIGYTVLSPHELLRKIKNLENSIGRSTNISWAPREIDIDIIDFEGVRINEENLKIPHPETPNRDWIIRAIAKIYPEWHYKDIKGKTL